MFFKRSKLKQPVCPKCRNDFIGRATDMENFLMVSFILEVWTPFPFQIDSFFIAQVLLSTSGLTSKLGSDKMCPKSWFAFFCQHFTITIWRTWKNIHKLTRVMSPLLRSHGLSAEGRSPGRPEGIEVWYMALRPCDPRNGTMMGYCVREIRNQWNPKHVFSRI